MAKKSLVARDVKRLKAIKRYAKARQQLKQAAVNISLQDDKRHEAQEKLQKLPRNANPVRYTRRCSQCGRPHAVYRKFGLCRICLRIALMSGHVPGGRKSSW